MSLSLPAHRPETFRHRRERLAQWMRSQGCGLAILPTGSPAKRSDYATYPFRFDSQFYYLTGFTEPDAWLVIQVDASSTRSILFCQPKDEQSEIWEGVRWGPEAACEAFGVDAAFENTMLDQWMAENLIGQPAVFLPLHRSADPQLPQTIAHWIGKARSKSRGQHIIPSSLIDITEVISAQRLVKDGEEVATMRRSAQIAAMGHIRAMRAARPGLTERALEAELLYAFLGHGAQSVAYETIVATGANACILHHRAGHSVIKDNDLILIDAGCELDGYAADITRTFPANGKFSSVQAALYDIVLAAQQAAVEKTRPGNTFNDGHDATVRVLTQGLIDEGLLKGSVESNIEQGLYQRFYMHRTGHWLGLDVHDVGPYREPAGNSKAQAPWVTLQPGMVLTIEPGLYIRPADDVPERAWNIGIRIEDDALVTEHGCELITRDVPVERAEIEAIMRDD